MLPKKAEDITKLLEYLQYDKANHVLKLLQEGNNSEVLRYTIFSKMALTNEDIKKLLSEEYWSIEIRMEQLSDNRHFKEVILLGTLFFKDYKSERTLYGEDILLIKEPVSKILYFFCKALLRDNQHKMCTEYIKLLSKISYIYPEYFDPIFLEDIDEIIIALNAALKK